jgi:hypothetical protein
LTLQKSAAYPTKPQGRRMGRRVMNRQGDLEQYVTALFDTAARTV